MVLHGTRNCGLVYHTNQAMSAVGCILLYANATKVIMMADRRFLRFVVLYGEPI